MNWKICLLLSLKSLECDSSSWRYLQVEDLLSEGGEQGKGSSSCLCTFGTQHLRMVLHPMSFKHNIDLSDNFYAYFDLKNIFKQFYGSVPTDQATHDSLKCIL